MYDSQTAWFSTPPGPTTIIPAVWDLLSAAAAVAAGATHLFLSGGALSSTLGYPDKGIFDVAEITEAIRRIKGAVSAPLMADIDTGYGSLYRLARLISELQASGVEAVMIEDQDETGQSVASQPKLCDPDLMCRRIQVIRETAPEILILARSDCIPGLTFRMNLDRLQRYRDAGADWLLPVFVGSKDDLMAAAEIFGSKLWLIAVGRKGSYVPSYEDASAAGAAAILITSQIRNVYADMKKVFQLSLSGEFKALEDGMIEASELQKALRRDRFEGQISRW